MILKGFLTLGFIVAFVWALSNTLTYFGALVAAFLILFAVLDLRKKVWKK